MHFMIVSFQLGHINENGNNITVIPEMEGREKDTNTTVSNLTMTHLKKILLHFLGVVCFNSPLLNLTRVDVMVVLLIFAFSSFKIICPSSGHCPECRLQISFEWVDCIDQLPFCYISIVFLVTDLIYIFLSDIFIGFLSLTWFTIFSVTYDTRDKYIIYPLSDQECDSTVFSFLVSLWTCDVMGICIGYPVIDQAYDLVFIWYQSSDHVKYDISSNMFAILKRLCSFPCFKVFCHISGQLPELRLLLLRECPLFYTLSYSHKILSF